MRFTNKTLISIEAVPKSDKLILLGDFNVRVGNERKSWPGTIGAFGIGKINDNGKLLLVLSVKFQLCVANIYTRCKYHTRSY